MKAPKTLLLALPVLLAAAPADPVQDPAAVAAPAAVAQDDGASVFGEPLYVNGRRITDAEIKSYLCYGKGRNALEARKLGVLMQQERELREFTHREEFTAELFPDSEYEDLTDEQRAQIDDKVEATLAYMLLPEGAVAARLKENLDKFNERYPTLDADTETRRAYHSVRWYEEQVQQTMEFDAMFYPGHPDDWPELTREAVQAGAPNVDLLADYAQHYQWRLEEAEETGEPMRREEEMMMSLLRDFVMEALASLVEIKTQVDGLPPEILMTVEGGGFSAEMRTEEVYQEMKHVFTEKDIENAKLYLALHYATLDKLTALGTLQERSEFMETMIRIRNSMQTSVFNWGFIAMQGHQFPSVEAYTENVYLLESYKDLIVDDLQRNENNALPDALVAYVDVANVIMGLGRCQAEMMLISAFDFPGYRWKDDGWAWAEQKAYQVRQEIDAHIDKLIVADQERRAAVEQGQNYEPAEELLSFDEYWSNMLDQHSEYWDPPMPMTGHMPPAIGLRNRGRFQGEPMTRNDFKRNIGESSFSIYLQNDSITDRVFFELEPGQVGGPFKGPEGYYITYLRKRNAPTNPIDPNNNERHYQMLVEEYVRARMTEFAHEALAAADVKGL